MGGGVTSGVFMMWGWDCGRSLYAGANFTGGSNTDRVLQADTQSEDTSLTHFYHFVEAMFDLCVVEGVCVCAGTFFYRATQAVTLISSCNLSQQMHGFCCWPFPLLQNLFFAFCMHAITSVYGTRLFHSKKHIASLKAIRKQTL